MKLLNIFKRSNDDQQIIDSFKKMHPDSMQELITTLSHYDNHILAAALFKAATLINLMDPNQTFVVNDDDLQNQDEAELVDLSQLLVDMADIFYAGKKDVFIKQLNQHVH